MTKIKSKKEKTKARQTTTRCVEIRNGRRSHEMERSRKQSGEARWGGKGKKRERRDAKSGKKSSSRKERTPRPSNDSWGKEGMEQDEAKVLPLTTAGVGKRVGEIKGQERANLAGETR